MGLEEIEFARNPEPRCPVILLLDTSYSMEGSPIDELNQGIHLFKDEVQKDDKASKRVEVSIVTFGDTVQLQQDFVTVDEFNPPYLGVNGLTPMGQAIEFVLDQLEGRKLAYKVNGIPYYRPWVFLVTDGAPTDTWQNAAQRVHQAETDRKLSFFAVGVQGADMNILRQIAPPQRPPVLLKGLAFKSLFAWLSSSMSRVSGSKVGDQIAMPSIDSWAQVST